MTACDQLREAGKKAGVVRIRMWRPFPFAEIAKELGGRKAVVVVDRALSTGGCGGPVASEVKGALYHLDKRPQVVEYIAGLGKQNDQVTILLDTSRLLYDGGAQD